MITITFSEDLNSSFVPSTGAFTLTISGSSATITSVTIDTQLHIHTSDAILATDSISLSYVQPDSNPLTGTDGLVANSFSNFQVTNTIRP